MVYMLAKTYRPSGVSPKRLATAETYRFIFHRDSWVATVTCTLSVTVRIAAERTIMNNDPRHSKPRMSSWIIHAPAPIHSSIAAASVTPSDFLYKNLTGSVKTTNKCWQLLMKYLYRYYAARCKISRQRALSFPPATLNFRLRHNLCIGAKDIRAASNIDHTHGWTQPTVSSCVTDHLHPVYNFISPSKKR